MKKKEIYRRYHEVHIHVACNLLAYPNHTKMKEKQVGGKYYKYYSTHISIYFNDSPILKHCLGKLYRY